MIGKMLVLIQTHGGKGSNCPVLCSFQVTARLENMQSTSATTEILIVLLARVFLAFKRFIVGSHALQNSSSPLSSSAALPSSLLIFSSTSSLASRRIPGDASAPSTCRIQRLPPGAPLYEVLSYKWGPTNGVSPPTPPSGSPLIEISFQYEKIFDLRWGI